MMVQNSLFPGYLSMKKHKSWAKSKSKRKQKPCPSSQSQYDVRLVQRILSRMGISKSKDILRKLCFYWSALLEIFARVTQGQKSIFPSCGGDRNSMSPIQPGQRLAVATTWGVSQQMEDIRCLPLSFKSLLRGTNKQNKVRKKVRRKIAKQKKRKKEKPANGSLYIHFSSH